MVKTRSDVTMGNQQPSPLSLFFIKRDVDAVHRLNVSGFEGRSRLKNTPEKNASETTLL